MSEGRAARDYRVDERLAVYGSLAPGAPNAHILAPHTGIWVRGTVRGNLELLGWGSATGYPGIRLTVEGPEVPLWLFCSDALPGLWSELDAFEGAEYQRSVAQVAVGDGVLDANIYELARNA